MKHELLFDQSVNSEPPFVFRAVDHGVTDGIMVSVRQTIFNHRVASTNLITNVVHPSEDTIITDRLSRCSRLFFFFLLKHGTTTSEQRQSNQDTNQKFRFHGKFSLFKIVCRIYFTILLQKSKSYKLLYSIWKSFFWKSAICLFSIMMEVSVLISRKATFCP